MTSKTISTTIHSYKFAASDVSLTITSTGKIVGTSSSGDSAIYGGTTRAGESVLNLGTVSDAANLYGVFLRDGATITNGSASDTTASISGPQVGISIAGKAGTITNFGSISSETKGIVLKAGGTVTNGSSADKTAKISGAYAVVIDGAAGKVTNFGTIKGPVNVYDGGSITNEVSGTIVSEDAIYLAGPSTRLTNLGTISGVVKVGDGQVVNGSATNHTASISGGSGNYGLYLGTGTLTNYGTITGSNEAVSMQSGTMVIAEAGSKLVGPAAYGDEVTLTFGSGGGAGTITGLGTGTITGSTSEKFKNLVKYEIQAGASWTLSGTNTLKSGELLTDLGTLSLDASLTGAGKLSIGTTGSIRVASGESVAIGTVANAGALVVAGGTLTLDKAVSGAGAARISGGALVADSTFTEGVTFEGKGTLELAKSQTYTGSVTGFSKTGLTTLDLEDIVGGKATFAGTTTGGTLTVTGGTDTAKIKLVGDYTGVTFKTASDGHGGTKVVDAAKTAATLNFVAAMATVGAVSGASTLSKPDAPPIATLSPLLVPRA